MVLLLPAPGYKDKYQGNRVEIPSFQRFTRFNVEIGTAFSTLSLH